MDKFKFSSKHVAINKSSAQTLIAVSVASFILIFCLIAAKSVLSQYNYQSRVMSASKTADTQLNNDLTSYNGLAKSYVSFNSLDPNVIGAPVTGTGNNNTQVVLNALPAEYDYPALESSLYYIMSSTGVEGTVSSGAANQAVPVITPGTSAVQVPVSFDLTNVDTNAATKFLQYLQQSTRPIPVDSMTITADQSSLTIAIDGHTYYQPATSLNITSKAVN